ncbi:ISAs1 family transposase [Microcoleus vaginatus]|uniref:ISAs1 family transposase n=1 Tax=Microcoleus vaginatus TaxID=119532 RepID=UPI004040828B
MLKQSVLKHFQQIPDPRVERTRHHSLEAILTIAILAVLSGADGFVAIEVYGKTKQSWLEQFLDLPHGIPSHDTFGRVIGSIDAIALQESFLEWIATIAASLKIEVIHIDGKTSRGSYDREGQLKALHTVSAWSSEHGLVVAQQKVKDKSNEITAVPQLLTLLNLKGAVVTLDAMGTQTEIARQIKRQDGNYLLALKGNQLNLYKQVESWFEEASTKSWEGIEYSYHETVEAGHHRVETRQVWVVSVKQLPRLHRQSQWEGLTTVVMVRRRRQLWNKTTTEIQFYLSSLEADAERHSWVIRSHWSIENSLHWVLDVTFNEDASRIRQGNAAQNLGLLRHLSISLLKQEPSKLSLKMKRYTAGMDNNFLLQILSAGLAEI